MYSKIAKSIFFKLILTFTIVLSVSFVSILIYSTRYLNERALNSLETESVRALNTIEEYISAKLRLSKQAIASLYTSPYYAVIPEYLASDKDGLYQKQTFAATLDSYLQLYYSVDSDIFCIAVDVIKDQDLYVMHRDSSSIRALKEAINARIEKSEDLLPRYGFQILPAYTSTRSSGRNPSFSMLCNIKSVGMQDTVGHLLIDFSTKSLKGKLSEYYAALPKACLYILSADGTVLYDTADMLTGLSYPDFEMLNFEKQCFQDPDHQNYIILEHTDDLDLYFMSVLPLADAFQSVKQQKALISGGICLLIALSLLSILIICNQYYRRITVICTAIREIQSGNLDTRIEVSRKNDELSLISSNLNDMCDMLREHIQKVYVNQIEAQSNALLRKDAELKQKIAELYALQAQINPHFLYNTLESIRMRALSSGNRDVGRMIYLLSTLFRQSLKEGFATSISEELQFCRLYLDLMLSRYPERVHVQIDEDITLRECGILRHILQPILENAIQHGIDLDASDCYIQISTFRVQEDIFIQVTNNGSGISPEKLQFLKTQLDTQTSPKPNRIGLSNVHQRLVAVFGKQYGITIESRQNENTKVSMRMPYLSVKEMDHYVQRFDRG